MRRRRFVLAGLVGAIALVVVVYAVLLGTSAWSVYTHTNEALQAYEAFEQSQANGDLGGSYDAIKKAAEAVNNIDRQLSGWEWGVASNVPIVGEDVTCAQQTATVADKLMGKGLMPVLTEAQAMSQDVSHIGALINALDEARSVVESCRGEADRIVPSHFDQLNELVDNLRASIQEAHTTFDSIGGLLDVATIFT